MRTFHLTVLTPGGTLFDGEASKLRVRTALGEMGILAGRLPVAAALAPESLVSFESDGEAKSLRAGGGYVHVQREKTSVLLTGGEWVDSVGG